MVFHHVLLIELFLTDVARVASGLLVRSFHVQIQLGHGLEWFTADLTSIPRFRVLKLLVTAQSLLQSEGFVTFVTLELFLSTMQRHVVFEVAFISNGHSADGTDLRLVSVTFGNVNAQGFLPANFLGTFVALKKLAMFALNVVEKASPS